MTLLKRILYIASIILPIIDAVRGAHDGVKKGLVDLKSEAQRAKWEEANRAEQEIRDVTRHE